MKLFTKKPKQAYPTDWLELSRELESLNRRVNVVQANYGFEPSDKDERRRQEVLDNVIHELTIIATLPVNESSTVDQVHTFTDRIRYLNHSFDQIGVY